MANSPPICQDFMMRVLAPLLNRPGLLLYIYMDDIILGTVDHKFLDDSFAKCLNILESHGFQIAPEKVQKVPPFKVLGTILTLDSASPNSKYKILIL